MANYLKREKKEVAIAALAEGNSVRSTERMTGVHRDTILRLMCRVGEGCAALSARSKGTWHLTQNDDDSCTGNVWTFVAIDPDSKVVPCYRVGKRNAPNAKAFMDDLSRRLSSRIQLSSDSLAT